MADFVLKDLKKIYENAIKPLENLYKYRDLSNRHFGDPEIFSKPLVLFMGPWSGGKSTILNYLTDNEHTADSLRTGNSFKYSSPPLIQFCSNFDLKSIHRCWTITSLLQHLDAWWQARGAWRHSIGRWLDILWTAEIRTGPGRASARSKVAAQTLRKGGGCLSSFLLSILFGFCFIF